METSQIVHGAHMCLPANISSNNNAIAQSMNKKQNTAGLEQKLNKNENKILNVSDLSVMFSCTQNQVY